jgi:choline dehydrogenase-like flavoprotein
MVDFDYVIAGNGTAGCVLASLILEDSEVRW